MACDLPLGVPGRFRKGSACPRAGKMSVPNRSPALPGIADAAVPAAAAAAAAARGAGRARPGRLRARPLLGEPRPASPRGGGARCEPRCRAARCASSRGKLRAGAAFLSLGRNLCGRPPPAARGEAAPGRERGGVRAAGRVRARGGAGRQGPAPLMSAGTGEERRGSGSGRPCSGSGAGMRGGGRQRCARRPAMPLRRGQRPVERH